MEFDEIVVKESPGLCRCCLSEGCYKDMGTEYSWMNENEVYAEMLLECFDVGISQHNDGPNGPNRLICEVCITRLRDACYFKKQVLDSEKKFVDMVGRGEFKSKVLIYQSQMKSETADDLEIAVEAVDTEYLEDDIDFINDDMPKGDDCEPTGSEVTADPLPVRNKRGRPRKTAAVKPEKKKVKAEHKTKSKALVKGTDRPEASLEAPSKTSITNTKRNRLMKRNAVILIENSTVTPFKWHRHNYLCFFCHLPFTNPQLLKEHTESDHDTSNVQSAVSYLRRDEKVKIDVSTLDCKCGDRFDEINDLADHLRSTHGVAFTEGCGYGVVPYRLTGDTFHCAVCQQQFQYFIKLNQHMNEHYGSYVCEMCGKSFLSQDRLRCHALRHGSKFKCNVCPESFNSLTLKNSHQSKVHNQDKRLKCFFCPETFSNYNVRKRHHSSTHNMESPEFKCPECGKVFHIMSKMQVHLKEVHIREKNYACTVCEQRFFSKTHVQRHMVKHFGERVFQCSVCMKSYARKQTLRDHMRTHSTEKRFICSVCSQGFVQNSSLRLHLKVHHPESSSA